MNVSSKPKLRLHSGQPVVSSHHIAVAFSRRHSRMLSALREAKLDQSPEFFASTYTDVIGQTRPCFLVSCRGFEMLSWRWRRAGDVALRQAWLSTWQGLLTQRDPGYSPPAPYYIRLQRRPKRSSTKPKSNLPVDIHPHLSEEKGRFTANTIMISLHFKRKHAAVFSAIETLIKRAPDPFGKRHFTLVTSDRVPYYRLDEAGFIALTVGWHNPQATLAKAFYFVRFHAMGLKQAEAKEKQRLAALEGEWDALSKAKAALQLTATPAPALVNSGLPAFPEDGLVTVRPGEIGGVKCMVVDARELHQRLGVAAHFRNWIARRLKEYDFQADSDFRPILGESLKGRPSKEYHLSLDTAKEMAMVEKNEMGRKIRRYFIDCEQRLIQSLQQQTQHIPALPPTPATANAPALPDPHVLRPQPKAPRLIDKARVIARYRDLYVQEHGTFIQKALVDFIKEQGYPVQLNQIGYHLYVADTLYSMLPKALDAGMGRTAVHSVRQIQSSWSQWWTKYEIDSFYGTAQSVFSTVAIRADGEDFRPVLLIPALEREACALMDMSAKETALTLAWPPSLDKARLH